MAINHTANLEGTAMKYRTDTPTAAAPDCKETQLFHEVVANTPPDNSASPTFIC